MICSHFILWGNPTDYNVTADGLRKSKTVNGVKTQYYYVGDTLTYQICEDGTELYFFYDSRGALSVIRYLKGDKDYHFYVATNLQGDVVGIYTAAGLLRASYEYDAWGNVTVYSVAQDNDGKNVYTKITNEAASGNIGAINPIRYRGYYYDTETGFYYLHARYYCPKIGRFISADSLSVLSNSPKDITDKNLFSYCDNNPITREDSSGGVWETVFDVVSLAISIVDVCANPDDPWAWVGLACDTLDLIPFLTGVGEAARVVRASVKIANKTIDVADSVKDIAKVTNKLDDAIDTSVDSVRYTEKVAKQMSNSSDLNHSFPALIDTFVDIKSGRPFKGGDGIVRTRIEIPGKINNTPGVYEYIIEPNGMCNHRYFKKR